MKVKVWNDHRSYQSPEIPNKGKYNLVSLRRCVSDKNGELLIVSRKAWDLIWAVLYARVCSYWRADWLEWLQSHFPLRHVLLAHGCPSGVWIHFANSKIYQIFLSKCSRNKRNFVLWVFVSLNFFFTVKVQGFPK